VKYFINSIPKSGTYLCSNLLTEFNLKNSLLHIGQKQYQKYSLDDLEDCRKNPEKYTVKSTFTDTIQLINDNEYAVGHIPYSYENEIILKEFKKILLIRDFDEILQSTERWRKLSTRNIKNYKLSKINRIKEWETNLDVFVLSFDDMINKNLVRIDQLQVFLFSKVVHDSEKCLISALDSPSLTKSEIRS
jgi:hypothetical protein